MKHFSDQPPILQRIVDPVSPRTFVDDVMEKQPCLLQRLSPTYFDNLLSIDDIDRFFDAIKFRTAECFCVNGNSPIDVSEFSSRGVVDRRRSMRLFNGGATLILNRVHTYHEPLRALCAGLSNELCAPAQANVYLTPPRAQGFKAHYDTHDAFILQIHGSKVWSIYGSALELPLAGQGEGVVLDELSSPTMSIELKRGDTLYIPRGWVHEATTNASTSLHVTLGVFFFTWADAILEGVSHRLLNDARFRRALRMGFMAKDGDGDLAACFESLLSEVIRGQDFSVPKASLLSQFEAQLEVGSRGLLTQIERASHLTMDTRLVAKTNREACVLSGEKEVTVKIPGGTLVFKSDFVALVQAALSTEPFRVGDLLEPHQYTDGIEILRQLIGHELIRVVD